ncbi:hypothetical protein COU57_06315 [Candidatus Pacearchaeota archaeon CG10_big_fil_rev_8_21_14_0_10_32_14]|nr:MAG: hypothetical protein COU57_06315 [Candidatus Pacearchaeota archaeon CG10_big_fil_rev_8_21_14_0_10_32_14]
MTYELGTLSHGEIDSGFYAQFTSFVRIGKYSTPTRHLCEIVEKFAAHPEIHETYLLVYPEEKFWNQEREQRDEALQTTLTTLREEQREENDFIPLMLESFRKQGEVGVIEEYNLDGEGISVPLRIWGDESGVVIGEYEIASEEFKSFVTYVARGGLFGWLEQCIPDYSEPTLNAIRNSKRKLFKDTD